MSDHPPFPSELLSPLELSVPPVSAGVLSELPPPELSVPPVSAGVLSELSPPELLAGGCVCWVLSAGACVPPEVSLFTPGTAEKAEVHW